MAHRRHRHNHNPNHKKSRRRQPRFANVSPYELIREDFSRMVFTKRLRTTDDAAEWILMQSVEGHAQMGHGAFAGRRFPNTEMEDIVAALGREPKLVAHQRQGLIDEVCDWAQRAMNGNGPAGSAEPGPSEARSVPPASSGPKTLVNGSGEGLIGCGLLRHFAVDPADVLRGLYLGGLRDDSEVRLEVERRTGAHIGGGHCRFVNVEVMQEMGLDGEKLARGSHWDKIDYYQEMGLIVPDPGPAFWDDESIRYMYLRDRVGGGASDDAAIVAAGMTYNLSVALGVFLADAIDTLEKFVVDYEDQDGDIARTIGANFPDLNLTLEDVYRLTWVCHVPAEADGRVPDSSLRHLLEVDKDNDQNALESHLAYVSGHAYSPLPLGHDDVPNDEFYTWLEKRVEACPL